MAEATAAPRADGADERRSLTSAILLGVVGPEVFIVQPGFVQGMVQYLGFDDRAAGLRGLRRDVRHRSDDGRDDLRRAPLQLAQGRAVVARDHGGRERRLHAGARRHGVRGAAFCGGRRRGRTDLAVVRRDRAHSQTRPQFRLPDHVGADLRRLRPARDADGLSARGTHGRAVVLCAVPAGHAAVAQVLPGVR